MFEVINQTENVKDEATEVLSEVREVKSRIVGTSQSNSGIHRIRCGGGYRVLRRFIKDD